MREGIISNREGIKIPKPANDIEGAVVKELTPYGFKTAYDQIVASSEEFTVKEPAYHDLAYAIRTRELALDDCVEKTERLLAQTRARARLEGGVLSHENVTASAEIEEIKKIRREIAIRLREGMLHEGTFEAMEEMRSCLKKLVPALNSLIEIFYRREKDTFDMLIGASEYNQLRGAHSDLASLTPYEMPLDMRSVRKDLYAVGDAIRTMKRTRPRVGPDSPQSIRSLEETLGNILEISHEYSTGRWEKGDFDMPTELLKSSILEWKGLAKPVKEASDQGITFLRSLQRGPI